MICNGQVYKPEAHHRNKLTDLQAMLIKPQKFAINAEDANPKISSGYFRSK